MVFSISFFLLFSGDEILSVNGHSTHGLSHSEAIAIFKGIRVGKVTVQIARREQQQQQQQQQQSEAMMQQQQRIENGSTNR